MMQMLGGCKRVALLLVLSLSLSACHDGPHSIPEPEVTILPATTSVAELQRLYRGGTVGIESDVVLVGRVTTDDRAGNFYRSFFLEDVDGGAVEVLAGPYNLYVHYPVGAMMTLHLQGLALGRSYGVLQVGTMPALGSGFALDYIATTLARLVEVADRYDLTPEVPAALRLQLTDVPASMLGRLVRVEALRYAPEEETEEAVWAEYRRFVDAEGHAIYTYVRPAAEFAAEPIPTGECTLHGVLLRDETKNRLLLKLRDANDCEAL